LSYFHAGNPLETGLKKALTTIGPAAMADFPALGLAQVPCRIDTGAQTSSMHSSAVEILGDELKPGTALRFQPLHSSQWHYNTIHRVRQVKSSTGHTEMRVSVLLSIQLAGRKIKAEFTLADRSDMKFKVLIGRKLLRGKFLVNVKAETSPNSPQ
jgi:hypothetical protein